MMYSKKNSVKSVKQLVLTFCIAMIAMLSVNTASAQSYVEATVAMDRIAHSIQVTQKNHPSGTANWQKYYIQNTFFQKMLVKLKEDGLSVAQALSSANSEMLALVGSRSNMTTMVQQAYQAAQKTVTVQATGSFN